MQNYNKLVSTRYKSGEIKREAYYLDDKYHRIDGPADTAYYGSGKILQELY